MGLGYRTGKRSGAYHTAHSLKQCPSNFGSQNLATGVQKKMALNTVQQDQAKTKAMRL